MPAFNKFNQFTQDLADGLHDFKSGASPFVYKVLLTTTAPTSANKFYSDITGELTTANGYTLGGATVTTSDSTASGTETVNGASVTWTATGTLAARYAVLYRSDDTNKELVGWWDYGVGGFSVTSGNQLTITWSSGILTIA